jgi:enoyl-CoA hydratase/carnithine racemase
VNVLVEVEPPAARVTLNRPERRTAHSLVVLEELDAALRDAATRPGARAIVVAGAGPAFSAGHDLAELVGREDAFYDKLFAACNRLMETIHRVPVPVIARVHGMATAAGCQLVAACDLAVASEEARFATPGVKIGLFCSTPMVPVLRAVGRKRALELLLTGEPVDARTALDWGLVNRVVPAGELDAAGGELVAAIARSSGRVVALGKEAFYDQADLAEPDAYDLAAAVIARNASLPDAQEGMSAFLVKRAPVWP